MKHNHPLFRYPNQLKAIRKQKGLLQKDVANLLGHSSIEQLSRYEQGVNIPTLPIALALEQIYQVPLSTLFAGLITSTNTATRHDHNF
jgi:transcriptional regulator with XRE-family HTH domain